MSKDPLENQSGTIVVIDDTPESVRLLLGILTEHGYKVRPATDGAFALQSVWTAPPDLILLDIKMPGMDGYEVCQQLKADDRSRAIPIIFLSALDTIEDKVKGFKVGGIDYITKLKANATQAVALSWNYPKERDRERSYLIAHENSGRKYS